MYQRQYDPCSSQKRLGLLVSRHWIFSESGADQSEAIKKGHEKAQEAQKAQEAFSDFAFVLFRGSVLCLFVAILRTYA